MQTEKLVAQFDADTREYAGILQAFLSLQLDEKEMNHMIRDLLYTLMQIQEEVLTFRLKKIIVENNPYLPPIDVTGLRRKELQTCPPLRKLGPKFLAQRHVCSQLLHALSGPQWQRSGLHATDGHLTLEELVRRLVQYDRDALSLFRQILQNESRLPRKQNSF